MVYIPTKTYPPEFLEAMIADHEAEQAGATPEDSSGVRQKGDTMSKIMRFTSDKSGYMLGQKDGGWVRYQDHLAEVERLTVERDKAQAGDDVALSALTSALRERDAAQAEVERFQNSANLWQHDAQQLALTVDGLKRELHEIRPEAHRLRAEVKRLNAELAEAQDRCRALELSVEQADEMKAHAEASAAAEEAETDRVTAERDAAQAEVERLRAKVHELDQKLETAQIKLMTGHEGTSLDPVAQLRADVVRLTTERDEARAEVERLVFALQMAESSDREGKLIDSIPANDPDWIFSNTEMMSGPEEAWREENHRLRHERDAAQAEVERLRASGQEMRDTSRPSDETIWWKAFNSFLRDHSLTIEEVADQAQAALTIYRARWPR